MGLSKTITQRTEPTNNMKSLKRLPLLLLTLALSGHAAPANDELMVYFVGNSLTMSTTLDRVHALFEQRGTDLQFGSSLSAGKSLIRHLNYTDEPQHQWAWWETDQPAGDSFDPNPSHWHDEEARFGRWDVALREHHWDKLVLQLYGSNLHDDLIAIPAFIDLVLEEDAADEIYLYSTWPRRPNIKGPDGKRTKEVDDIDYAEEWEKTYDFGPEDTVWRANKVYATRDYVNKLFAELESRYPDLDRPLRLIPTAEVLYAIDQKIKADALPGLKELAARSPEHVPGLDADTGFEDGVNVLYADGIHLNPQPHKGSTLGIFISGSTIYTVLSGQSPIGMSGAAYDLDDEKDAALIRAVQETIWEVVTSDPRTG